MPRIFLVLASLFMTFTALSCEICENGCDVDATVPLGDDASREASRSTCLSSGLLECSNSTKCWVIEARPYDTTRECLSEAVPVGCESKGTTCGDALTIGVSPSHVCYLFSNTCLPSHWSPASDTLLDKDCKLDTKPICN